MLGSIPSTRVTLTEILEQQELPGVHIIIVYWIRTHDVRLGDQIL
jgi:hypothetical protein